MSRNTEMDRIIARFPNGEERFLCDPYFKNVIMALYYNADIYDLLNDVLEANFNTIKEFEDYARGDVRETKIYLMDTCKVCGNKQD